MELKDRFKKCLYNLRRRRNPAINFQFIPENPISGDEKNPLSFGHNEIVKTLKEIVSNCSESFTVGLYGDWGSGKSTIISSLQKELKKEEIPLVMFDVWKHEGDALRRTFLNTVLTDLKSNYDSSYFNHKFRLSERALNSKSVTKEFQTILKKKLLLHSFVILIFSAFLILPFFIFWLALKLLMNWDLLETDLGKIIGSVFSVSLLPLFYKYINQFIETTKETSTQDRFKDPHEFESEFKRILQKGFCKLPLKPNCLKVE